MQRSRHLGWLRRFGVLVLLGAAVVALSPSIMAAGEKAAAKAVTEGGAQAVPASLSPDAVNALVEKLSPEQVQALGNLMAVLGASADTGVGATAQSAERPSTAEVIDAWLGSFRDNVVHNVTALPHMLSNVGGVLGEALSDRGGAGPWLLVVYTLIAIAAGVAAEWLVGRLTAGWRNRITRATPSRFMEALRVLVSRAILELGLLLVFIAAAVITNRFVNADPVDRAITASILLSGIMVPRVVAAMLRFILAPKRSDLRQVYADDWTAQFLSRQFTLIAVLVGIAFALTGINEAMGGAVDGSFRFWVGLIVCAWIIVVIWRGRDGLVAILKGDEEQLTPGLERMAAWWPGVTIAIVAVNWLFLQFVLSAGADFLTPGRTALALALIVAAPFLDTLVRGIATHLVPPMIGEGEIAQKAHQGTRMCYVRVGRLVLLAAIIIAVGKLWGVNLRNIADGALGAQLAAHVVGFLLVIAVGYLAWEILNLWVNRQLAKEMPPEEAGEGAEMGGAGGSRLATILPIVHVALQVTVITLTVLLALSQLGVNITPLLAGAGVFGLAIGFGAQTLVKDIVSGVFFLLDDAFRIGEFIDVEGTMGTVEKISLRSLQLRGATGPVHIVPYGEMAKLTNLSRDWVIMKLRFTVPFDTDLEKVRKLFKKIGQKLLEDPTHADNFIEPFKSQGAAEITDVGIVIRGKFTAKPGTQFVIRKAVYLEVQRAFEENGIEFARREVRITMPELPDGSASNPGVRQGAAQAAAAVVADQASLSPSETEPAKA